MLMRRTKFSFRTGPKSHERRRVKVTLPRKVRAFESLIGIGGRDEAKKRALNSSKQDCMYGMVGVNDDLGFRVYDLGFMI